MYRFGILPLALLGACAIVSATSHANTVNVCVTKGAKGETKYSQVITAVDPNSMCSGEVIGFRADGRQNTPGEMAAAPIDPNAAGNTADQTRAAQLEQQIKEMEARENAQRCQTLKNSLANLNMGGRVYEVDANGNRNYLNAQEVETRRTRTQQTIAQFCN